MASPFSVGRPGEFTNRSEELERVLDTLLNRQRLVLYGERRMGKTHLLHRAAERVRADGGHVLYVDVWTRTDVHDLNRHILRQIPSTWLTGVRLERIGRALAGAVEIGFDADGRPTLRASDRRSRSDGRDEFERILRGIDDIAGSVGGPIGVIFDEFQVLDEKVPEGTPLLRGIAQESGNLAWVFAGSAVGMVREMIGPDGPFFGTPELFVGPIERRHLTRWMSSRMKSRGLAVPAEVARAIYDAANGTTLFALELANRVFEAAQKRGAAPSPELVSTVLDEVGRTTKRYEDLWYQLHAERQRLLIAVAHGEDQLFSAEARERYGLGATVSHHRDALRREGILFQEDPHRIGDPFFASWIRANHPGG